ncbi:MAG TPA: lytic murein transglycosylase B [Phycisphaerales bacterium]|nr:lytic murein transglycosylase B [Phycisphaerales bacterium]
MRLLLRSITALAVFLTLTLGGCSSHAAVAEAGNAPMDYPARDDVRSFIDEMVARHDFRRDDLHALFADVRQQTRVLEVIQRPAEGKPWYQYRPIFLNPARIRQGTEFWAEHRELLERAEATYGVPPEYLVAIIGVETFYGRHTGGFPVLDTLTTLGFDYPPRARFFRSELEHFLLLTREEGLNPRGLEGSYAGAMGKSQFISSSYRNFAVDFDGDGRRDLWESPADAIGSVANYFKRHGWVAGEPVTLPARVEDEVAAPFAEKGMKPSFSLAELTAAGVEPLRPLSYDDNVALIALDGEEYREYWLGLRNFYVITRYNHSPLYAMAVHQLAQEIRQAYQRQEAAR